MDRQTVYYGQVARNADFLLAQQNTMVGLAKLSAGVLGLSTFTSAFTCTPTTPASLNIIVTPGEIYQLENLEQSTWSSQSADTHTILKQGILLDALTFGITPPGTVGFSQNFLVECQYQDLDTGSVVLPYYNAVNPALPFSGPANAGTAQNTVRKGIAACQIKAGTAATTGTQTTPSPDAGWSGLFVVTVANGAATITSGNISTYSAAPFIPTTLPAVPNHVLNGDWVYCLDSSTTINTVTVAINLPGFVPAAYQAGMRLRIKMANACTGAAVVNLNGIGNKSIVKTPGSQPLSGGEWNAGDIVELTYDGTNFQGSLGQRQLLAAAVNLYVNPSIGSDTTLDGSSATVSGVHGPFATLTKALSVVAQYAPGTFGATINLSASTHDGGASAFASASWAHCNVTIVGAGAGSTLLTTHSTSANLFIVNGPNNYVVHDMDVSHQGSAANGSCLGSAAAGSSLTVYNIRYQGNSCTGGCFIANQSGVTSLGAGTITLNANVPANYFQVNGSGSILAFQTGLTIAANSNAWTMANFILAANAGFVDSLNHSTFSGCGSLVGARYNISNGAIINTAGGGGTYFPGNSGGSGGTTAGGGYYI